VGCRYWILPLTYTHAEDGTSPISKSPPSCPPRSQYTHAPLSATHHCAAVPPLIDSGLTMSTTVPCPSTSDQGSVDGIQTNRCHFGSPPPPIELDKYKGFEQLVCCLKGIWLHPNTVTPAKLAQIWEFRVTCGVEMMP
jgi:hypothetical protein